MSDTAQNTPYIYFYDTKLSFYHRNCNAGLPLKPATFNSTAFMPQNWRAYYYWWKTTIPLSRAPVIYGNS
jgi:hypothetical protein